MSITNEQRAVLDELERERAELDTTIRTLRRRWGLSSDSDNGGAENGVGKRTARDMRPDEFFGMRIIQAAKRYLSIVWEPQSATEIAKALRSHGLKNTSKGFPNTVYSMLYRDSSKPKGTIVSVDGKWGLKDVYQGRTIPPRPKRGTSAPPSSQNGQGEGAPNDEASE